MKRSMVRVIFGGPSIGLAPAGLPDGIELRPPARCGDVTRAVLRGAGAIGLIDGAFETTAAVWHKELLLALSCGIPVLGAASIGALRAVEMAPFGMVGIGWVYLQYQLGRIRDDDEVAVLHGPAELGYIVLNEPMVNVRATVAAAVRQEVLSREDASRLVRAAKRIFYKSRTWQGILDQLRVCGIGRRDRGRFATWLPRNRIDVKKRDALLLIDAIIRDDVLLPAVPVSAPNATIYWTRHLERCDDANLARPEERGSPKRW